MCEVRKSLGLCGLALGAALGVHGHLFGGDVPFRRGDSTGDARLNVSDAVFTLLFLFRGGVDLGCADAADADDDGKVNLTDPVYLLDFLFRGGAGIPFPGRVCGRDPTPDGLDCREYPGCPPPDDTRPEIFAFSLMPDGHLGSLIFEGPLGFRRGASVLRLHGLRFVDVVEAIFSDRFGQVRRVPRSAVSVDEGPPGGLQALSLDLHDDETDVRLAFRAGRDNMGVALRGPGGLSNRIEVPVTDASAVPQLGAVISGAKVPARPAAGPVRIRYTMYELSVSSVWSLGVDYSLDDGATWTAAQGLAEDPEHDGSESLLPGSMEHTSGHLLLPGRGAIRTFTWDGRLRDLETAPVLQEGGETRARFRLRLIAELEGFHSDHVVETPSVRLRVLPEELRDAVLSETFDDTRREDADATTAFWGPPENPGRLVGRTEGLESIPFGSGRAIVRLEGIGEDFHEPGESVVDEWIEIDTDLMEIVHHVVLDSGTPGDPADDATATFPEPLVDENGDPAGNPGEALDEFHLAALTIARGTRVVGVGSRPLILRLSRPAVDPEGDGVAFHVEEDGLLDLSGDDGEDSPPLSCPIPPNCGDMAGGGGRGGPGGGDGGEGGTVTVLLSQFGYRRLSRLVEAEPGGNNGGGSGATPGALSLRLPDPVSIFPGAPGGGGGHRRPGEPGDYGRKAIPEYQAPRVGAGGPLRGDSLQVPQTGGSGGGGGGGSVSRSPGCNEPHYSTAGAGGGGGGGALTVVARGRVVVEGRILANGGDGGTGQIPVGPPTVPPCPYPNRVATGGGGGGGSGGSIVIRATHSVDLSSCDNLQARGGTGGGSVRGNNQKGGDGAPGYIRIESAGDALPECGEEVSTGLFLTDVVESAGVSRPFRLGLGADLGASSFDIAPGQPEVVLEGPPPPGTRVILLWDGGRESLDSLGEIEIFPRLVADPRHLEHREFARFHVVLQANAATRRSPAVEEVRLPYALGADRDGPAEE